MFSEEELETFSLEPSRSSPLDFCKIAVAFSLILSLSVTSDMAENMLCQICRTISHSCFFLEIIGALFNIVDVRIVCTLGPPRVRVKITVKVEIITIIRVRVRDQA
jgi:hypothetical protein